MSASLNSKFWRPIALALSLAILRMFEDMSMAMTEPDEPTYLAALIAGSP